MKERAKVFRARKQNTSIEVSKRLSTYKPRDDEMHIDAGAGSKMRKLGPSGPTEERKEPHKNPFHMDKQM